jgi:LacI family transcriptional regulator
MSTPGRPTLADVAALAGVSLKTASRAMNEEYGVARATSERVFAAARELGFRPNRLAQSLAGGGPSAAVGLLIPEVADPWVAAVVGAVEEVLAARDLQLITASHGNDPVRQQSLASALVERRVDGLIIMSAPGDASYLRADIRHGLVVVAMDRPIEGLDVDTVTADNETGAREAVNRLLAAGHRRVAAVVGDVRIWPLARRLDGYRAALEAAGLPVDEALISTAHDAAHAQTAMQVLLDLQDPPTAVFAAHHRVGRGVMRAMHDRGSSLDLAVFDGVDDNDLLVTPPLVVAASGPDRVGQLAAELLVERLGGLAGPPRHAVLAPLLLGPDELYVPNIGAVDRVRVVSLRLPTAPAPPPLGAATPARSAGQAPRSTWPDRPTHPRQRAVNRPRRLSHDQQ